MHTAIKPLCAKNCKGNVGKRGGECLCCQDGGTSPATAIGSRSHTIVRRGVLVRGAYGGNCAILVGKDVALESLLPSALRVDVNTRTQTAAARHLDTYIQYMYGDAPASCFAPGDSRKQFGLAVAVGIHAYIYACIPGCLERSAAICTASAAPPPNLIRESLAHFLGCVVNCFSSGVVAASGVLRHGLRVLR